MINRNSDHTFHHARGKVNTELPGYRPVLQFKRDTVRTGGVCIYEKEDCTLMSTDHELLKFDQPNMQIKRTTTAHDGVGDICAVDTTINDKRTMLVTVYITPGTTVRQMRQFYVLNMMAYSPKISGLFEEIDERGFNAIPIILGGDFNLNWKDEEGKEFLDFMCDNFGLRINNNPDISTTRGNTSIDAVFTRHIEDLETRNYISYFSYHKPLLSITSSSTTVQ